MIGTAAGLIGFSVTFLVLNTFTVALRLISRRISAARLWWDDLFIVISLVLSYGSFTFIFIAVRNGMGQHASKVTPEQDLQQFKTLFASQIYYPIAMTTIKTSILLFYLRLFGARKWFRRLLYITQALVISWCIAATAAAIFRCRPLGYGLLPMTVDVISHCGNVYLYSLVTSVFNVFFEFWILLMPLPVVWTLQLPKKQKVAVSCIFMLGAFICGASIARAITVSGVNPLDITWTATTPVIWSNIEISVAIICACLPILRPLVQAASRKIFTHPSQTSSHPTWPSSQSPQNDDESYSLQQYPKVNRRSFVRLEKEPSPIQPSASWLLENRGFAGRGMNSAMMDAEGQVIETSRAKHEYGFGGVV